MTDPGPSPEADHPYKGKKAVLATMHGKEQAIAPPLLSILGLSTVVPEPLDTDRLGTFTGDVERPGPMLETAIAKARAGMEIAGSKLGLASEGSYGPHPHIPFIPAGVELLVLVDDARGLVLSEHLLDDKTNYAHEVVKPGGDLQAFLKRARFPDHALIVKPNTPRRKNGPIRKGLQSERDLADAIAECSKASRDKSAMVQTDMRAHFNPTRMATLNRLAEQLARRLTCLCPECGTPGFGIVDVQKGLPCGLCGTPSTVMKSEIWGCAACDYKEHRIPPDRPEYADPQWCSLCNP